MNRIKVIVLVFSAMLSVVALYYFQASRSFGDVFVQLQQDNTRRAGKLLLQAATSEVSTLKRTAVSLAKIEASQKWVESSDSKVIKSSDLKDSNFLGQAFLQQTSKASWDLRWISLQPQIIENWSEYLITKIYQSMNYQRLPAGRIHFQKIENHQKRPLWLMAFHVDYNDSAGGSLDSSQSGVLVSVLSNNMLSQMGLSFRGFDYEFILMDQNGFAVNHSTTSYISASFRDYNLFENTPFEKDEYFEGFYELAGEPMWGIHQHVPATNLRLVVARKVAQFEVAPIIFDTKWLIGLFAVMVMFLSLTFYLKNEIEEKFVLLKTALINFSDGVTDVPPAWRKAIPNSIQALEKLYARSSTENQSVQAPEESVVKADPPKAEEVEPESPKKIVEPIVESTVMRVPSRDNVPFEEGDEDDDESFSILPNETLVRALNVSAKEAEVSDQVSSDAEDDVRILAEISKVSDAPDNGFWAQKVIADSLRSLKEKMKSQNIQLSLAMKTDKLLPVEGKAKDFENAFKHVVNNAIESMDGVSDKVLRIKIALNKDEVQVDVSDLGHGLSDDDLDRVFDPFFTKKDSPDHPGLGLTAAKKSIEGLGGYVDIDIHQEVGTTVRIIVPLAGHSLTEISKEDNEDSEVLNTDSNITLNLDEDDDGDDFSFGGPASFPGPVVSSGAVPDMPEAPGEEGSGSVTADLIGDDGEQGNQDFSEISQSKLKQELNVSALDEKEMPDEMPNAPKSESMSLQDKDSQAQAKELIDDLINMQVKVRSPKVK